MTFRETKLAGAYILEIDPFRDDRGFFARTWCTREFQDHGLNPRLVQASVSYNIRTGTLRGMHFQRAPHADAKLVRCTAGSIFDVIIDLRPASATFTQWMSIELTAANHRMLYIPEGFAHGFQTLEDHTEVFYQMSEFHHPEDAGGVRWNDPAFGIQWPPAERIIAARDATYPDFRPRQ